MSNGLFFGKVLVDEGYAPALLKSSLMDPTNSFAFAYCV